MLRNDSLHGDHVGGAQLESACFADERPPDGTQLTGRRG
jgi:hypothetical protein